MDAKLQIRDGHTVAVLFEPHALALTAPQASAEAANAVLVFATNVAELRNRIGPLCAAAERGALAWLAYPKAKQLGTDLNRDVIRVLMPEYGLDTVRQVALDETWSALRLKSTSRQAGR